MRDSMALWENEVGGCKSRRARFDERAAIETSVGFCT